MTKKSSEYTDTDWERFDQNKIIKNYKHDSDYILWLMFVGAIIVLVMAFTSNENDKAQAQCLANTNLSAETCEYIIR